MRFLASAFAAIALFCGGLLVAAHGDDTFIGGAFTGMYKVKSTGMAFDAVSTGGLSQYSGLKTASWTHVGGSPTAVACVIGNDNSLSTISTVTYGGVGMSLATTYSGNFPTGTSLVTLWGLASASIPTGSQTVTVTGSTNGMGFGAVCYSVTGSSTSTVFDSVGTLFSNSSSTTPSISITSVSGEIVIDWLGTNNGTAPTGPNAGQTRVVNNVNLTNGPNTNASASWKAATSSSTSMGWSITDNFNYGLAGFSFHQ